MITEQLSVTNLCLIFFYDKVQQEEWQQWYAAIFSALKLQNLLLNGHILRPLNESTIWLFQYLSVCIRALL